MNLYMLFSHWPLADGGGDAAQGIFWLIVTVIVVISQVLKANKKSGAQPPAAAPGERARESGPGEELQRFMESLGGNARPTPAAPPKLPQTAPHDPARGTAFQTGRKQTASPAAYAKAKPVVYAKARPNAELSRKRVPPPPTRPIPPVPEIPDAWTKPRQTAFQHFRHSDDLGIKADAQAESLKQLRHGIGDDLVGIAHLRKAMVLKEILGPPLALRNPAVAS